MAQFSTPYSKLFMNKDNKPNGKPKWLEIAILLALVIYIIVQLAVNLCK